MIRDIAFAGYYIIASFTAACVYVKIRSQDSGLWNAVIMSQVFMLGSLAMLKWSDLSLIKQSALITLASRIGYLIGLVYLGESITATQWLGITIMTAGTFLTNK